MIDGGNDTTGESGATRKTRLTVIGWRSVIVWAIAALVTTAATTIGLWFAARSVDTARAAAQLDAIKTGLSIGVGAGGLFALWLATRRQRSTEVGLTQQERTIEATIADADEKRVTELYTKAAEQIGHDKAPVRLAGIYALERLAQDNPKHRQTIVNVLCAYLRMPFQDTEPQNPRITESVREPADPITALEEREIRITIQRILRDHLRPRPLTPIKSAENQAGEPNPAFWPGISINLDGAVLIYFDFQACEIASASFHFTVFTGTTTFRGATFTGEVSFKRAVFHRGASFDHVRFGDFAWFRRTTFNDEVTFSSTTFAGAAGFKATEFRGDAKFRRALFDSVAIFESSRFHRRVWLDRAAFRVAVGFSKASFAGPVDLTGATFHAGAWFRDVRFDARANFTRADFQYACFRRAAFGHAAHFARATFQRDAEFTRARFLREGLFQSASFHGGASFDSAVFVRAANFDGVRFHEPADFDQADFQLTGQFKGALFRGPACLPRGNVDLTGATVDD